MAIANGSLIDWRPAFTCVLPRGASQAETVSERDRLVVVSVVGCSRVEFAESSLVGWVLFELLRLESGVEFSGVE